MGRYLYTSIWVFILADKYARLREGLLRYELMTVYSLFESTEEARRYQRGTYLGLVLGFQTDSFY